MTGFGIIIFAFVVGWYLERTQDQLWENSPEGRKHHEEWERHNYLANHDSFDWEDKDS